MPTDAYMVRGMTCGSCVGKVMELVRELPGVHGVTVGYRRDEGAPLLIESRAPIPPDDLRAALASGGFHASGSSRRRARHLVSGLAGRVL